jgi:hypothetical protein
MTCICTSEKLMGIFLIGENSEKSLTKHFTTDFSYAQKYFIKKAVRHIEDGNKT